MNTSLTQDKLTSTKIASDPQHLTPSCISRAHFQQFHNREPARQSVPWRARPAPPQTPSPFLPPPDTTALIDFTWRSADPEGSCWQQARTRSRCGPNVLRTSVGVHDCSRSSVSSAPHTLRFCASVADFRLFRKGC